MLTKVKAALRLASSITAYDTELQELINSALADMGLAGVESLDTDDALISRAVITYIKLNFGQPGDYGNYEQLKRSYDEQKAQLSTATDYNGVWL